jgi:hypothetical protein
LFLNGIYINKEGDIDITPTRFLIRVFAADWLASAQS